MSLETQSSNVLSGELCLHSKHHMLRVEPVRHSNFVGRCRFVCVRCSYVAATKTPRIGQAIVTNISGVDAFILPVWKQIMCKNSYYLYRTMDSMLPVLAEIFG